MKEKILLMKEAVIFGFKETWNNKGFFLLSFVLILFSVIVGLLIAGLLLLTLSIITGANIHLVGLLAAILAIATVFICLSLEEIGYTTISLDIYKKDMFSIKSFFPPSYLFLKFFIAYTAYILINTLGMLLLFIPYLIFWARFSLYKYYFVEQNTGIIESLRSSWHLTKGYTFQLIILNILFLYIKVFSLFLLSPANNLSYAFIYKKLLAKKGNY